MPSKKRREAKLKRLDESRTLETVPIHIELINEMEEIQLEKLGTTDKYTSGKVIKFDNDGHPFISPSWGRSGPKISSEERLANRKTRADNLKLEFAHIWGLKGKAGIIGRLAGISVRTVQKYFKDYPVVSL